VSSRPVTAWLVPLEGHAFDLEDLPVYLKGSAIQVTKGSNGYQLELPASIAGCSHERVVELSAAFVDLMNGAASLVFASYRPIQLADGSFYGIDQTGSIVNTVLRVQSAEMRCKAGHVTMLVDGIAQQDTRQGQITRLMDAADGNVAARDALSIMGRSAPSWSELYLVYELVEANAGNRMYAEKWIARTEGKRLTRTANSYTALGRASRHGKQTTQPPRDPMTQREATVLMRALVAAWLSQMQEK